MKDKLFKSWWLIIAVLCAILIIIIGFFIMSEHDDRLYADANEKQSEADAMRDIVVYNKSDDIEIPAVNDKGVSVYDSNIYERISFDNIRLYLEDIKIDDVYGWLYIPGTIIDYIVMQGDDKEPYKYLWKDPNGKNSKTGSLFIRNMENDDANDAHTIIYGHHLKNHNLYFGALFEYRDFRYACDHRDVYLYKKDSVAKYELCSVCEGKDRDPVYFYPYETGSDEYEWMISETKKNETLHIKDISKYDKMLVLSTCSGERSGQTPRLYLILREVCDIKYEDISK